MEEVVAHHDKIAECAVIGAKDNLKGEKPLAFVVLKKGAGEEHDEVLKRAVSKELISMMRTKVRFWMTKHYIFLINYLHKLNVVAPVDRPLRVL
jgi:propionyl-CoA synthetase